MTYLEYCKMLIKISKEAKKKDITLQQHVNNEIKIYQHLVDNEKENDEFFKRITKNAGPRDY